MELLIAVTGALIGAIAGFLGTRTLDRAAARRQTYVRILGPAEIFAMQLIRRMDALSGGHRPPPEMPAAGPMNEPMGEAMIIGSDAMLALIRTMIGTLSKMQAIVIDEGTADRGRGEFAKLLIEYNALRRQFIQRARHESAIWPLRAPFWKADD